MFRSSSVSMHPGRTHSTSSSRCASTADRTCALGPRKPIPDLGIARVKSLYYNYLPKKISFVDQKPYPNDLGAGSKPDNAIFQEMQEPALCLKAIDVNFGMAAQMAAKRKCDTCVLVEGAEGVNGECVEKKETGHHVCTNCYGFFGRSCCSWTPGLLDSSSADDAQAQKPERALRALEGQPNIAGGSIAFDGPQLRKMVADVVALDDGNGNSDYIATCMDSVQHGY